MAGGAETDKVWSGADRWGAATSLSAPLSGERTTRGERVQNAVLRSLNKLAHPFTSSAPNVGGEQPNWRSIQVEGSEEYRAQGGAAIVAPAGLWDRPTATRYWGQMAWEQIRTVVPIAAFLLLYMGLVLQTKFKSGDLLSELVGIACAIVGLTIFMEGLKFGMMPLGEAVGMAMGKKLSRTGVLTLACALGILVTLAEPAIGTLRDAGKLIKPSDSPYLFATLHQWADNMSLQISIGFGVGLACTAGMMRSMFRWQMKRMIFAIVPVTLLLTIYAHFVVCDDEKECDGSSTTNGTNGTHSSHECVPNCPLRPMVFLAWDCGAVTTGPVTVPLVLALGVGVSADSRGGDDDSSEADKTTADKSTGTAKGEEEDDSNWASAFGVVTLASLFPVITVLLYAIFVHTLVLEVEIEQSDEANKVTDCTYSTSQCTLACLNEQECGGSSTIGDGCVPIDLVPLPISCNGQGAWYEQVPFEQARLGLQAVCPLVFFLVSVLRFMLKTELPEVKLPDPNNLDPAAPPSDTSIHVMWGAFAALLGIIVFNVGLSKGLIALGQDAGKHLPVTFQFIDENPGAPGCPGELTPPLYPTAGT